MGMILSTNTKTFGVEVRKKSFYFTWDTERVHCYAGDTDQAYLTIEPLIEDLDEMIFVLKKVREYCHKEGLQTHGSQTVLNLLEDGPLLTDEISEKLRGWATGPPSLPWFKYLQQLHEQELIDRHKGPNGVFIWSLPND